MARNLPPLNALRAFEAAGRHQSFSRAAEELGVNHSSISRHVRGLEDRLGARLFRDLPRGVALTERGARYLDEVSPALDRIAEASEALAGRVAGVVTVDAEPLLAAKWLVPRLGDFYARYPEVDLRLGASRELVDVTRYEADMAIRFFRVASPNPDHLLLSAAPLYPYAAPRLIEAPLPRPEAVLGYRLLQDRPGPVWARWLEAAGADPAAAPEPGWRMRATLAIEAAVAGQGVILAASDILSDVVARGDLIRVSDVGFHEGSYNIVMGAGVARRAAVRIFRDWLLEVTQVFRPGGETQPLS